MQVITIIKEITANRIMADKKPFAISGMCILGFALSTFWVVFPEHLITKKYFRLTIQISGIVAMLSSFFLLTNVNHDLIVNIESSLGFIATIGTLVCLYQTKWYGLFVFGLFNILLVGLNNYLYNTEGMIIYLPVVQKISFLSFLVWICFMNYLLILAKKQKKKKEDQETLK